MSMSTLQQAHHLIKRAFSFAAFVIHEAKEDSGASLHGAVKMLMNTVDDFGELEKSDSIWDQFHDAALLGPETVATVADIHDCSYHVAAWQFAMRVRSAIRCPGGEVANILSGGVVGKPEECSIRSRRDGSIFTWTSSPVTHCEVDPPQLAKWWPKILAALSSIAVPETERTVVCLKNELRRTGHTTVAVPLDESVKSLVEAEIGSLAEFEQWAQEAFKLIGQSDDRKTVRLIVERAKIHARLIRGNPELLREADSLTPASSPLLLLAFLDAVMVQVSAGGKSTIKGVSLRDLAMILNDNDRESATASKRRWQNRRKAPHLPTPLGLCRADGSSSLYAPSAILKFVKEIEGATSLDFSSAERLLKKLLRPVR